MLKTLHESWLGRGYLHHLKVSAHKWVLTTKGEASFTREPHDWQCWPQLASLGVGPPDAVGLLMYAMRRIRHQLQVFRHKACSLRLMRGRWTNPECRAFHQTTGLGFLNNLGLRKFKRGLHIISLNSCSFIWALSLVLWSLFLGDAGWSIYWWESWHLQVTCKGVRKKLVQRGQMLTTGKSRWGKGSWMFLIVFFSTFCTLKHFQNKTMVKILI